MGYDEEVKGQKKGPLRGIENQKARRVIQRDETSYRFRERLKIWLGYIIGGLTSAGALAEAFSWLFKKGQ